VILNRDDNSFDYLNSISKKVLPVGSIFSYGLNSQADFYPKNIISSTNGMQFDVCYSDKLVQITTPLFGKHNLANCLAALTATIGSLRIDGEVAAKGVMDMKGIAGRMERIDCGQDFMAIVDFAHHPTHLKMALESVRVLFRKSNRCVWLRRMRDREKRRMMAEISAQRADISILTAEDPRTESLEIILSEMASGMDANGAIEGKTYWRVPDRREALRLAVNLATPDDLVIAFGKGHEQSMCFGDVEYPWDDRQALRAAIAERVGIPGPEMPFLPT
jgi:UDP-N-acetylmuramoyl-L-alanyl-D-glutamate--2,6-diaminopimelate ligase